jgi:putative ABC transport system permease protein
MWVENIRIALRALRAHRFRSLLTVLSITVGSFSIVLMSSFALSGLATLVADTEELGGERLLYVWPKLAEREESKRASYSGGFTTEDRAALLAKLPHVADHTAFATFNSRDWVADSGNMGRTDLVGSDEDFFAAMHMKPVRGRVFNEEDNRRHAKVCVVGAQVADEAFDGDAVGHTLVLGELRCKVIGQLDAKEYFGMLYPFDWLNLVATPIETVAEVEPTAKARAVLQMKTDSGQNNSIVKRIANLLLLERHNGQDDFQIFDFGAGMKKFDMMFVTMQVIVGFIAGIALLVGGIGVMNMMLVSVSERVREIGIRKALGAGPRDIRRQFLFEAATLAGIGGVTGVVTGVGAVLLSTMIIRHFKPSWVSVVAWSAIVAALAVSLGVGLLFGYFPARRAAKMDAILAMRQA